jgi:hypothetical protein
VFDEGTGPEDLKAAPDLWLPPAEGKAIQGQSLSADGTAVALGPDGAIYLAGSFSRADLGDGVLTSRGSSDGFLIKYDRTWRRLWARTFGRDYADVPDRVEVDALGNATVRARPPALVGAAAGAAPAHARRPGGMRRYVQPARTFS